MSSTQRPSKQFFRKPPGYCQMEKMFFIAHDESFGTYHTLGLERDIIWLFQSETEIVIKNNDRVFKSLASVNDYYGFLHSTTEWNFLENAANNYDLGVNNRWAVEMVTRIKKIPVLEDTGKSGIKSQDVFRVLVLDTDWRLGTMDDADKWRSYYETPLDERLANEVNGVNLFYNTISAANPQVKPHNALELVTFSSNRSEDFDLLSAYQKLTDDEEKMNLVRRFKDRLLADIMAKLPVKLEIFRHNPS